MRWQDVESSLALFIKDCQLPAGFHELARYWYWPLAEKLSTGVGSIKLLGINGAQGTGKSTLASLLKLFLEGGAGLNVAVLSLDDFYLTRQQRKDLAATVHPLLQVRGVPGTHDAEFAITTIKQLLSSGANSTITLPRFDKSTDDRAPQVEWPVVQGAVDLVIFEGWCVGSQPQTAGELLPAMNALESEHDPEGVWRRYVNEQLASTYRSLFGLMDGLVMLKAPGFDVIHEWRWLQEQKLIAEKGAAGHGVMDRQQLEQFIQYYERLTRHVLSEMPARAELVYHIDTNHDIIDATGRWSAELF